MQEIIVTQNPNHMKGEISFEERAKQIAEQEQQEALARKKEKNSPYGDFAHRKLMGRINEKMMYQLSDFPTANKLFWFIVNHMDGYNALIASYAVFQEGLNMSESSVTRGIKKLKELGLLYIKKSGATNVYLLNPDVVWKSWGSNLKYCEFPAKVVLTESEQLPDISEIFKKQMHRTMELKDKK